MGEGLLNYLRKGETNSNIINKKCFEILHRIVYRTLTTAKYQGSEILSDWMTVLTEYFRSAMSIMTLNEWNDKIGVFKEYINGSFSMNTLP
jgi:hypothetical protein